MSTAPNLRMLFNTYHNGFDNFPAWIDHHKAMHAKHPLECAEFGAEWVQQWEAVGRLLEQQCRVEYLSTDGWRDSRLFVRCSVGYCITKVAAKERRLTQRRIVLLDGTIVKEWSVT